MLRRDEPYRDLGPEWLATRNEEAAPADSSPSWRSSGTPWLSIPQPDPLPFNCLVGLRPTALTRALGKVIHGSACLGEVLACALVVR
jgi:hypothetical protein